MRCLDDDLIAIHIFTSSEPSRQRAIYFGRAHFGTIFGFITGINSIGAITGAPLVGWVFDTWGSYQGVWGLLTGISVVAVILVMTTARVKTTPARYVQI